MPSKMDFRLRPQSEDEAFRAFVARVKLRLYQLDMSQTELARKLGLNHGTLSGWMLLKYMPQFSVLPHIGKALRCDTHWLLTGEGKPDQRELTEAEGQLEGEIRALQHLEHYLNERQADVAERAKRKRGRKPQA